MNPVDHTRFIVACLLVIVLACIGCGTYLFVAGYQSGELLIGIAGAGAGSLGTMVAMRRNNSTPDGQPIKTEIQNTASDPVNVQEVK